MLLLLVLAGAALAVPAGTMVLRHHDLHPDRLYRPYMAGPVVADSTTLSVETLRAFRELLQQYEVRQGVDDNFTIRVTDNRDGRLLERFVLEDERAAYAREGTADWVAVDRLRRSETRRLVDKYERRGLPRRAVSAKWGRADQVLEARRTEEPFLLYEVRLARYLGLSLLAPEIGTVETFNDDRLVSSVGARSRYQMMPFLLRLNGLNSYRLRTAAGTTLSVADYWHPLMAMEAAFITLRGYANAVGHEIPGLSAYHAGPGNIYRIYREFMTRSDDFSGQSNVVDAFLWGLTDGFDVVSRGSSFGSYSRGYVPSLYGSLRAAEDLPIDTTRTVRAERVQLRAGREITLSELLFALGPHRAALDLSWTDRESLYDVFRLLNPHLDLPPALEGVPARGDVRLVSSSGGDPVRFFVPPGASAALAEAGVDVLDPAKTFRFDHATYGDPAGQKTDADRDYDALVADVAHFGFTERNRRRLADLHERFERLAATQPSHFRSTQLRVIETHVRLWDSAPFEKLREQTRRSMP